MKMCRRFVHTQQELADVAIHDLVRDPRVKTRPDSVAAGRTVHSRQGLLTSRGRSESPSATPDALVVYIGNPVQKEPVNDTGRVPRNEIFQHLFAWHPQLRISGAH